MHQISRELSRDINGKSEIQYFCNVLTKTFNVLLNFGISFFILIRYRRLFHRAAIESTKLEERIEV